MDRQSHSLIGTLLVLGTAALLSGCPGRSLRSSPNEPSTIEQPASPPPATAAPLPAPAPAPRPAPRENHLSPATSSLVTQAHTLMAHGDLDGASSTLDRALRIEPNNPLLWIERGRLRLAENDPKQAEGCARKALALASGDRAAQAQSGHLLADALRAQKRNQEAHDVEAAPYMQ
jgi:tetratricopeptide (TPR) repeat protein